MEILDTEQNTDTWLEDRKKIIGGSDVPIIMGLSPWKTKYQLWLEKKGESQPKGNEFIFQKGHMLEDRARVIYELMYGLDVPPKVVKHLHYDFAQVSLDGLNLAAKKVVEFKYVGQKVFDQVKDEGYIPEHYYPQLQYQIFCTGYDSVDFVAYCEKRDTITKIEVKKDIKFIVKMVAYCEEFYHEMQNHIQPDLTEQDYKKVGRATIRRTVEALKKLLVEEYGNVNFFKWDGIYMELRDEEKDK